MQSPLWEAQPLAKKTVRDAIREAASTLSTTEGEVGIVLTDDSAIAKLNRDWRGIDKPTNVLSFPASGHKAGDGGRLLGDIIIGVVGAFIGGSLFRTLGVTAGGLVGSLVMATIGAIVLIVILRAVKRVT